MPWICASCNRLFSAENKQHSCIVTDLQSHFINKPSNLQLVFQKIITNLEIFGSVDISPVKNAIIISARSTFMAIKPRKKYLEIEFVLNEERDEFPVYKTVRYTKLKFAHFVRVENPVEIDQGFLDTIHQAYLENVAR